MGIGERWSPASEAGRLVRKRLPRRDLADLVLPADRDPVGVLEDQHASRLQDLVPVRVGRMLQSPFSFYRGTAAIMAADLRDAPSTELEVVSCGDAHISNFGFFASPERALVFDLNDFDEAGVAPWEWDVRRLTTSVYISGRDIGLSEDGCRDAAFAAADAYREMLRNFCSVSSRERYYTRVDTSSVARHLGKKGEQTVRKAAKKARARTSERVLQRLTTISVHGGIRIVDQPPVLRHVDHATLGEVTDLFTQYRTTLREDIAFLLEQYRVVDFALRVVGVGSVGTRCYLIAVEGPTGDILFLQAKEAPPSVLATYGGRPSLVPGRPGVTDIVEGHRVVAAQRILQANSDPFVGWIRGWAGDSAERHRVDYYWRQFRDMKGSIEPDTLNPDQFRSYGALCASLLARAHGQSPAATAIVGYLGRSEEFAEATASWSAAYADLAEADFEQLRRAVASGRLPAETGV
ncbi:DUF2252 domain-containing protein [Microbacterium sp. ET2]|uniref:DUF2252 domain-containing protein n=1 Tax=Microbacterium albipurpureum TaxID=3050384 RepID=UPI00259C77F1|nr:DUF2252 domain-containing protein [Microbacterium sp. ET2 (Ac-2212)]WJL96407.1 DUF2252 domain-containing protein [Microbacterium sp. ET2 (Ac-2212)]